MRELERPLDAALLYQVFMGGSEREGLFEQVVGFRTATTAIKPVHIMNDLAQCVVGGAPDHGGDLLCRVVRQGKVSEGNTDFELRRRERMGADYRRAFPSDLGQALIRRLRSADELLLNFDGGIYEPGKRMCSGLATHKHLLGFEGFRRFRIGRYLERILGAAGRARILTLLEDDSDPVSVALRPLLLGSPLVDTHPPVEGSRPLTRFDERLGVRLTVLLSQPIAKPQLLRFFILAACLGVVLKVLGAGRADGRPGLLALPERHHAGGPRPARQEAVQSFQRAVEALHRGVALALPAHPEAEELWRADVRPHDDVVLVPDHGGLGASAEGIVALLREQGLDKQLYWPEGFATALGRKVGCVLPRHDNAGWGKYLSLTPDLLEALVLMFVPAGSPPIRWEQLWTEVWGELGVCVGANGSTDAAALRELGVLHVNLQGLTRAADALLDDALVRGVARRLPDAQAEVGGALE